MTFIFYLLVSLTIWYEIGWIQSPRKYVGYSKLLEDQKEAIKGMNYKDLTEEQQSATINLWCQLIYILLIFVGLFSAQWVSFLFILAFNMVIIGLLSALVTKYGKIYTIIHWFNSLVGIVVITYILLNHYHLHIDTLKAIRDYFHI